MLAHHHQQGFSFITRGVTLQLKLYDDLSSPFFCRVGLDVGETHTQPVIMAVEETRVKVSEAFIVPVNRIVRQGRGDWVNI